MQTQWRVGMSGATGLDYAGVRAWLDEMQLAGEVPADERAEIFACICAAERSTLDVRAARREAKASQPPGPQGPPIPPRI